MSKLARDIAEALLGKFTQDVVLEQVQHVIKGRTIKKSRVEYLERVEKDYYSSFDFTTTAKLIEALEMAESALSLGVKTHDAAGCPGESCSYPYDTQKMVLFKIQNVLRRTNGNV